MALSVFSTSNFNFGRAANQLRKLMCNGQASQLQSVLSKQGFSTKVLKPRKGKGHVERVR